MAIPCYTHERQPNCIPNYLEDHHECISLRKWFLWGYNRYNPLINGITVDNPQLGDLLTMVIPLVDTGAPCRSRCGTAAAQHAAAGAGSPEVSGALTTRPLEVRDFDGFWGFSWTFQGIFDGFFWMFDVF